MVFDIFLGSPEVHLSWSWPRSGEGDCSQQRVEVSTWIFLLSPQDWLDCVEGSREVKEHESHVQKWRLIKPKHPGLRGELQSPRLFEEIPLAALAWNNGAWRKGRRWDCFDVKRLISWPLDAEDERTTGHVSDYSESEFEELSSGTPLYLKDKQRCIPAAPPRTDCRCGWSYYGPGIIKEAKTLCWQEWMSYFTYCVTLLCWLFSFSLAVARVFSKSVPIPVLQLSVIACLETLYSFIYLLVTLSHCCSKACAA